MALQYLCGGLLLFLGNFIHHIIFSYEVCDYFNSRESPGFSDIRHAKLNLGGSHVGRCVAWGPLKDFEIFEVVKSIFFFF